MASNNQGQLPGHDSSRQQPIPLQDLARDQEFDVGHDEERRGRRRSSSAGSTGGARTHVPRRSLLTGGTFTTYERIAEDSPSPVDRVGLHVTQPSIARTREHNPYTADDHYFIDDPGGFAQATGSLGLDFQPPYAARPASRSSSSFAQHGEEYLMGAYPGPSGYDKSSSEDLFSPTVPNSDTAPLTDKRYLQPISGATVADESEERTSMQSIRLGGSQPGSRLGDDLNLESGFGSRRGSNSAGDSRSRSISPSASSSALQRAGSVMKMMSQRVVNLSNEPVEQTLMRKESTGSARLEGPPDLPETRDFADESIQREPVAEKRRPTTAWRTQANPFRGKSLGIFSPDNPMRMWLCDVLVHPFTEPFILLVIVIHAILLTVESASSVWTHPRSHRWGSSLMDYALFVIFAIYTIELVVRTIVSGFFWNPHEYSTLDRSLGFRKAVAEKGRSFFSLQREPSTKKKSVRLEEPEISIFQRTFTGLQPIADLADDPRQRSRKRLAYRAFLRHSFNRLDFVAVISYWASFFMQLVGYESSHHVYIFQMLSCLRLLRLLGITNGTSVSSYLFIIYRRVRFSSNSRPGHSPKLEKSGTTSRPCRFSHWILLATFCDYRDSELQVKPPPDLCLD